MRVGLSDMAVGRSLFAARLYDKIINVGKIAKYKLSQCQFDPNVQKQINYMLNWMREKSAKNISID
ncbi:hypothetical protein C1882_26090 [Pseudomonas sp. FW305-E2]|nr:hypothetical protein [Pseudomonas sp. BN607]POA81107.1 hypothetical protein C1882_26090 [Pseudomonas sp. FW305-E2]